MQNATAEAVKVTGTWTAYDLAPEVLETHPCVEKLRAISRGDYNQAEAEKIIEELRAAGTLRTITQKKNIVPTVGRAVLARRLSGDTTYSGAINYMAVGTGTTAFSNASTLLNAEVFRKLVSSGSFTDNIAYIDVFIASSDVADQTFTEAAAFIDGSTGSTTGQAFSLIIQDFVKSGSMFISLQVTFT